MTPATKPAVPKHLTTLEQQKSDFTAEGAPPPAKPAAINTTTLMAVMPPAFAVPAYYKAVPKKNPSAMKKRFISRLAPKPQAAVATAGALPAEPMKQAARDLKRGLQDTDRGPEAGRTYKKLKG